MTPGYNTGDLHKPKPPGALPQDEFAAFIPLSCWQLWKARNAVVFRGERTTIRQLLGVCKAVAEQWRARFLRKTRHIADVWCQVFESAMHE